MILFEDSLSYFNETIHIFKWLWIGYLLSVPYMLIQQGNRCLAFIIQNIKFRSLSHYDTVIVIVMLSKYINMMKYVNRGYAFFVFLICLYKQGHLCLHNIIQNIKFRSSSYYDKLNVIVILLKKYINLIKYVNSCCALCSLYAYISKVTTAYIFD